MNDIINVRRKTHGSFADNARISQQLKALGEKETAHFNDWSAIQVEAYDMICLKLSRILSGHQGFDDHWRDIAGYATLVVRELEHATSPSR